MTEKDPSKKKYSESNFRKDFQAKFFTSTNLTIHIRTNSNLINNIISPKQDRFHIISFTDLKVENSYGRIFLKEVQVETSRDSIYRNRFMIVCARNDKNNPILQKI